jgi:hypothetical protein
MLPPIYSTLRSSSAVVNIVGNSIYRHGAAPQGQTAPYITWSLVFGQPENTLSELPQIDSMQLQVDCWHAKDAGVEELATAVRNALEPYAHMTGSILDEQEPDTKLYRMTLQFDWWLNR